MSEKITTKLFIERAKKIHGNKYDYSECDYKGSDKKVLIKCNICGNEFLQTPNKHVNRKQGCPICGLTFRKSRKGMSTSEFIEKALIVQEQKGRKYDYSKVDYVNNYTEVEIICSEHGSFWQIPRAHLSGQGCPKCWKKHAKRTNMQKYGVEHPMKSEVFVDSVRGILFSKTTKQKVMEAKRRNGTFATSKIQDELQGRLFDTFGEDNVLVEYSEDERYPFHCDFYIKSKDLFIELNAHWTHGKHWFDENNSEDLKELNYMVDKSKTSKFYLNAIEVWTDRDVKKREYARKNNLNYVVLWNKQDIDEWFNDGCCNRFDW